MISDAALDRIRAVCDEERETRLAVDALVATLAGDDLSSAIARAKKVSEALPGPKPPGRRREHRHFNTIARRTQELLDTAITDLERLAA